RSSEVVRGTRPVTFVSNESRAVVYLDESASLEIIHAALKAWGLRVREEREQRTSSPAADLPPAVHEPETTWETARPEQPPTSRLGNELSPLWLPIRKPVGNEAIAAWSWFTRAA